MSQYSNYTKHSNPIKRNAEYKQLLLAAIDSNNYNGIGSIYKKNNTINGDSDNDNGSQLKQLSQSIISNDIQQKVKDTIQQSLQQLLHIQSTSTSPSPSSNNTNDYLTLTYELQSI